MSNAPLRGALVALALSGCYGPTGTGDRGLSGPTACRTACGATLYGVEGEACRAFRCAERATRVALSRIPGTDLCSKLLGFRFYVGQWENRRGEPVKGISACSQLAVGLSSLDFSTNSYAHEAVHLVLGCGCNGDHAGWEEFGFNAAIAEAREAAASCVW